LATESEKIKTEFDKKLEAAGYVRKEDVQATVDRSIFIAREQAKLDSTNAGWETTMETDDFKSWLKAQSDDVHTLAESDYAKEAGQVFDLYEKGRAQTADTERKKQDKNNKVTKLKKAIPPTKGGDKVQTGAMTEHEAIMAGFNS